MKSLHAQSVESELRQRGTRARAVTCARFFKTGPGQYGAGDVFVGVTVPEARRVARVYRDLSLGEVEKLLKSEVHECRFVGLVIVSEQYKRAESARRGALVKFYLKHAKRVNNWDLVDTSAPRILGDYLLDHDRAILYKLAQSKNLWERRIAVVATLAFIMKGESADTLRVAELLLDDPHDLIHKATGWMLREVGKRASQAALIAFLREHKARMPRTMLRYAIEHFPPEIRRSYLARG